MQLYSSPFSRAYWKEAVHSAGQVRNLAFAALMAAACIVLGQFRLPVGENLTLSVTFLARALCALVYGPVGALLFGAAEDTLGFFLSASGGPYFPGYMLTTMLGCFLYALFFYRTKITLRKIILVKVLTNVQNVLLGSVWSAMLYGKGYLYYASTSLVKNVIYLPFQVLLLAALFQVMLPVLQRQHLTPLQAEGTISW